MTWEIWASFSLEHVETKLHMAIEVYIMKVLQWILYVSCLSECKVLLSVNIIVLLLYSCLSTCLRHHNLSIPTLAENIIILQNSGSPSFIIHLYIYFFFASYHMLISCYWIHDHHHLSHNIFFSFFFFSHFFLIYHFIFKYHATFVNHPQERNLYKQ